VQGHDQFLDAVQGRVLVRVQEYAPVFLGRDRSARHLDAFLVREEQGRNRSVQGQGDGRQFGRGEGAATAFGLMDGLSAPGLAQVSAYRLAQFGERHPPRFPQAGDLSSDGFLDPHGFSRMSFCAMT
jgi:hypothetical protein